MYRTPEHQTLSCDVCGTVFDDRPRHQGDLFEKAETAGWFIDNQRATLKHLCPDCKKG